MCNEETLAIEQWLLLHETRVPHFDFFQVTGLLRIEDYYYAMRILHKSWPACFKPWKRGAWKMVRLIAGKWKHAVKLGKVFFSPPQQCTLVDAPSLKTLKVRLDGALSTWYSCRCPCPLQGSWTKWPLRVPSSLNYSVVLWNGLLHMDGIDVPGDRHPARASASAPSGSHWKMQTRALLDRLL